MNATFLSSGNALAAGTVATPDTAQASGQPAGVFQALLAGQNPQQTTVNTPSGTPTANVEANINTTNPDLTADQAIPDGSVLSQTTIQTLTGATVASLPPTSDRLDVQSLLTAAAGDNAPGAVSSTPSSVTAPSLETDPLMDMLEPLRQQLAALGIDIDTLAQQAGATDTLTPPGLVAKVPVQDQINTLATGKAVKPIQDVLTAAATGGDHIAETPVDMLSKARPPEPHRPDALPTRGETLMQRIAARLDGLKQQLAEAGLPDIDIQALVPTINTVNSLAQRPLPASIVMEQLQASASASTPSTKAPVQSPIPVIAGSAAHSARPASAPGAQLAERNAKPANASKGLTGAPSPNPAQASATTQSSQPVATPGVTPSIDTTAPDLRPMAAMPGQASLDQPLLQSQPSTDTSLSFRPEQDLSLQRADGRLVAERAASEGQRFTPQSAQQLAAQITRRFANGSRVFDIRLDPAELGRVDVRLELSQDQRVQAILSAERPETLAELQRSARELERALNEAGLELEKDGLEFQLSENSDDPDYNADEDPDVMPVFVESNDLEMSALANDTTIERDAYGFRLAAARDRLDVRI